MNKPCWTSILAILHIVIAGGFLCVVCVAETMTEPDVRIDLSANSLPKNFFAANADTKCAGEVIGYRFVVWLNNESVAVGFNTSPNCRVSPRRKVSGSARLLVFGVRGDLRVSRDLPYEADGDGIVVTEGEGRAGPAGTLLFRIEEVHQSKSGILLLDANLKDVARLDRFLEQTTFVNHALVFQEGFTLRGPRTYSIWDGSPPAEKLRKQVDWPVGTMDRKLGEHGIAFMLCEQELQPNVFTATSIVYANARRRCTLNAEAEDGTAWNVRLEKEGTATIIGLLADGSVAGQANVPGSHAGQLVIWKKGEKTEKLPWIPPLYSGAVQNATANMSRYGVFATEDSEPCLNFGKLCSQNGYWMVFDRGSPTPIVNRGFPKIGRAALSPNGLHYATFESGELRIYALPKMPQ
jgi:hypothetical protein